MDKPEILQEKIELDLKTELEDDPYAKIKLSTIAKQKLAQVDTLSAQDRYKALSILKKQINERYLEEIPLAIANLPNKTIRERQQAYYGIFLLLLGTNLQLNSTQHLSTQQVVAYVVKIDKIIEYQISKQLQHEKIKNQITCQLLSLFIKDKFKPQLAKKIVTAIITTINTKFARVANRS
jgi:S-adenosylhomocysteine hydrolase